MSFTYSDDDLSTDLAKVRLQIDDTVAASALLTDEEIQYAIDDEPNVVAAAARSAEFILAKFAKDFNWEGDGTRIDKVARTRMYKEMVTSLRTKAAGGLTTLQTFNADGYNANRNIDHAEVRETLT